MRKFLSILLMSVAVLGGCNVVENNEVKNKMLTISNDINSENIAPYLSPAIVGINGYSDNGSSVGSGVCVTENGYVLTNSHVVHDCNNIVLYLYDKSKTTANIVYEDTVLDFAILKSNKSLPYLNLGDSDSLNVGEDVLAVGTPLSLTLTHTFTEGIVSALNRTLKVSDTEGDGYMQNLIQHDASLNPGNSGGPLINSKGEVVGINTLKISGGEGIGFAIPTKSFRSLLSSYVTKVNYTVPYLGVYGLDSEIANYHGKTNESKGFYIIDISSISPLKNLQIKEGSVITKINGNVISNTLDLKNELYKLNYNDKVEIEYSYGGIRDKVYTRLSKKQI